MGLLLTEVVIALHPEHVGPGHVVTIRHLGDPVTPSATWWNCSCGVSGTISTADVRRAMEGLVTCT